MKKTVLALVAGSAISLTCSPLFAALQTNTQHSIQSQVEYSQFTTKRQVVDQLLADALTAFKSPARISHAGFTAKMPSNMEVVTSRLLEAYALEPYRTDLLISAANAQVYNKNIDRAVELFYQVLNVAPEDLDAHSYLAVWEKFNGNESKSAEHMQILKTLNPGRANDMQRIFATIERVVETPLKASQNQTFEGNIALVALGYALNPDGSMHDILLQRLNKTLELARQQPQSLIVLTGGVPKNHKTEGKLMADWLVAHGIQRDRIIEDNYARSTVENSLYSSYALARHDIDHATIISSASHVRRGQTLFEIANWKTGPKDITFDTVAAADKPLDKLEVPTQKELLGIYRDALRTYGMYSYRSYPLVQR